MKPSETATEPFRGYYSAKAVAFGVPTARWRLSDGTEAEVTMVCRGECSCQWDDCAFVGIAEECVRLTQEWLAPPWPRVSFTRWP